MRYKSLPLQVRTGSGHEPTPSRAPGRSPGSRPHHRLRDWILTLPILLLVPALLLPSVATLAGSPAIAVSGTPFPGQNVTVTGTGFSRRADVVVEWDAQSSTAVSVSVSGQGRFSTRFVVPSSAQPGTHVIGAYGVKWASATTIGSATPLAQVTVTLPGTVPTPSPTPVRSPSPAPTVTPTVPPTPAPTPTPAPPAATATPAPTAPPTATAPPPAATPAPTATPAETNLAPGAQLSASSQDATTGQTAAKAVDGVVDGYPGDYTREWATVGGGAGSWLRFTFSAPVTLDRAVLYDRPNGADQVTAGSLHFSDGTVVSVGTLDNGGAPLSVSFTARTVTSVQFSIDAVSASTLNIGLAEAQLYGVGAPGGAVPPTPAPTAPAPTAPPTPAPTAPAPTAPPTPAPTATPAPSATPAPTPGDPWAVPFLGRTPSGQLHLTNCANVTISGRQFVNIADDAIIIEGCNNVTITGNDFSGDVGAVYAVNSTNVTVTWNRFQNIGNGTIGSGHSNFVQFNNTWGGYIGHNKGIGGNTEDLISVFQSGGASAGSPLVIEYNAFQGTNWSSGSGSGSMLGDAGGSHIVVRYNTYLSPGQVGIGVPSGTDIHITDNTVYGATRTSSNVGIYVWNQASATCSGIEIARNQVKWYRADGVENPYWNAGNCGTVSGESTNNWHAAIDPATLQVTL